ncbi:flagellin, partial [Escherichia coli]|nr:flagellin [Escherichia coli]
LVNANGAAGAEATRVTIDGDGTNQAKIELSQNGDTAATSEFAGASTNDPLTLLDKAIASVDKFRSSLGAVQNRLSSAVTNLNNT